MGVVSNIIDALRRIGKPPEKSAIARQDRQLEGKEVLERRREIIRGPEGNVPAFIATTKPTPETVHSRAAARTRPESHADRCSGLLKRELLPKGRKTSRARSPMR